MPNARFFRVGRTVATILVIVSAGGAQLAWGQASSGNILSNGLIPLLNPQPAAYPDATAGYQQPMNMPRRAPMARLIENPDQTDGAPPFALTDQTGTIQRYVEPVPGIDLLSHVGQVVTVHNDTGSTLLASQLELPPQAMRPMAGNPDDRYATVAGAGTWRRMAEPAGAVQQAQYVDNDDSSVQLLPDEGAAVDPSGMATGGMMPMDGMPPSGNFPAYSEPIGPPAMVGPMVQPNMPMQYPPGMMGYPTGGPDEQPDRPHLSADIDLLFFRTQIAESAAGHFSEANHFSPRLILGLGGVGNLEGRLRFWHYDHNVDLLGSDHNIGLKFNVVDLEALHRFEGRRSEFALAGGVRFAGVQLDDTQEAQVGSDLFGLTLAGDGLTRLGTSSDGSLRLVYGGRLSILGGDWHGDSNEFMTTPTRSDNVLVHELYGGLELARCCRGINYHVRLFYEMQNWHSDALGRDSSLGSIGFFGPGLQLGADF